MFWTGSDEQADRRFFLYLQLSDLHAPYEFGLDAAERLERARQPDSPSQPPSLPVDEQRVLSDRYDVAVAAFDRSLGRLLDGLDERGLSETTIVCVTSDHGQELFEHGSLGADSPLFDEALRVPLVFAGPGVPVGEVLSERVESRFAFETVRRLARVGTAVRGADLLQRYARVQQARAPFFFALHEGHSNERGKIPRTNPTEFYAVDVDGFRLFWSRSETDPDRVRLYDLSADPAFQNDVAELYPQRTYALQRMIASWLDLGNEVRPAGLGGRLDGSAVPRAR